MAFTAGYTSSVPGLRTRKVYNDCVTKPRTPRLVLKPGSYQATTAAGEIAFVGGLPDVQQISIASPETVPQDHLIDHQLYAGRSQQHLERQQQQQQHSHVLPLSRGHRHDVQQLRHANGHAAASNSSINGYSHGESAAGTINGNSWHSNQCPAAAQQSVPLLLPAEVDHQQHIDHLLSTALASTSAAAGEHANDPVFTPSSSSKQRAVSQTHIQQQDLQQQQLSHQSQQQLIPGSTSYSSNSSSSSSNRSSSQSSSKGRELPSRQLVRPNSCHVGARTASPAQIAAVATILLMKQPAAQLLLDRVPQLMQLEPAAMQESIQQLSQTLGVTYKQAAYMSARQPQQLFFRPAQESLEAAQQLAVAVGLPGRNGSLRGARVVINAATNAPALLVRPQKGLAQRLSGISSWLGVSVETALSMAAAAPELLTDSFAGMQRRVQALRSILLLWPVAAQRLAVQFPSVLFLSSRIVNNKVKVLMAIMHKDRKAIGLLVYKTPQLLRCDLERVRICYQMLPVVLQRSEGFVYAMAAHNAELLLLPPPKLLVRGARLLAALQMVSEWQQQWQQLRPPQVEEGLASKYHRFERLEYLVSTQQTSSIGILEALRLKPEVFNQRFIGWDNWWTAKQQRLQQFQQQQQQQQQSGVSRGVGSSFQQQYQQQQDCGHQQLSLAVAVSLTPEQQQLQQQYQQLVHEHLRQLQQRHRQRQMQLQQYRAQLMQQRALRWQQLQKQLQRRQVQQEQSLQGHAQYQQQQQQHLREELELLQQQPVVSHTANVEVAAVPVHTVCNSNTQSGSDDYSRSCSGNSMGHEHLNLTHLVSHPGSSMAAAAAVVAQVEQQQQQLGSHAVAAVTAECTVERVSAVPADALQSSAVVMSAAAAEQQKYEEDTVVQPQQRRQQQHMWQRQQTSGLLHGRHQQQQQRLWQPAAIVEGI